MTDIKKELDKTIVSTGEVIELTQAAIDTNALDNLSQEEWDSFLDDCEKMSNALAGLNQTLAEAIRDIESGD